MRLNSALGCRPCGDHDRGAGLFDQASICMFLQRIEVDGVAGAEPDLINSNGHLQLSLKKIKQLDSGMEMGRDVFRGQRMKVRQEGVEFSCIRAEIQRLEMPGNRFRLWIGRQDFALVAPRNGNDMAFSGIGKEIIKPNVEDQRYPDERRQCGYQPAIFKT